MSEPLTAEERAELAELLAKATPGPWRVSDDTSLAGVMHDDGTCTMCEWSDPVWIGCGEINGRVMDAHAHPGGYGNDHEIYTVEHPRTIVAGNYDWEEGGIIRPADADLIVKLRNLAPRLLASPEPMTGVLSSDQLTAVRLARKALLKADDLDLDERVFVVGAIDSAFAFGADGNFHAHPEPMTTTDEDGKRWRVEHVPPSSVSLVSYPLYRLVQMEAPSDGE